MSGQRKRGGREDQLAPRLARLPQTRVSGMEVPVATGFRARLLGLALLDRSRAGAGLLIPGCRGVHTFGMRFPLRLVFLDAEDRPLRIVERLPPRRCAACAAARAVLELPAVTEAPAPPHRGWSPFGTIRPTGERFRRAGITRG